MNTVKIFQNSWSLMLRYRALWIFGVILALTSVSFGSTFWLRDTENLPEQTLVNWEISAKDQAWIKENFGLDLPLSYKLKLDDLKVRLDNPSLSMLEKARLLNFAILAMVFLLVILVVVLVLRYTAEVALIKMVHGQQNEGEDPSARKGWSLGFSTRALKLFLIDLLVYVSLLILSLLLFLPVLFPMLLFSTNNPGAITFAVMLMTSLALLGLVALIVMWIAGTITLQLARRSCCLEELGVFASIWRGFRLMRAQFGGVGLTWLIIVGLDLVYPILVVPIGILLAAFGLTASGLLALILGALLVLVLAKTTAWTIAIIVGLVLLVLAVALPMILLGGLREVFKSSAWTLTFSEAIRSQGIESKSSPQPALQQVSSA